MNKFNYKNLCPFKWFVLQNFPFIEADFDAITNWQLFCKLGEEMNKIIEKVNQAGEQTEDLTNAFIELQNYVNNYFENLNVQDEINNKLDEMAESGQLEEIISLYLNSNGILAFNTVADMKNASNVINGSFVKTYGFHKYNDKGGNFYKIRNITNEDVIDEISIISINTTTDLIAELIEMPVMYVEQYGAYGDGVHDDTNAIQYAINKHLFGSIHFSESTYLISQSIKTYVDNSKQSNIIMEKTSIIKTNTNLYCLFELGGLGGNNESVKNRMRFFINGILDATNCESGIKINGDAMGINIVGTEIKNFNSYGIYVPLGATYYSSDISIRDCYINGNGSQLDNYGIYFNRPDNKMDNVRINAVKTGIYCGQGGQIIRNVHGLVIFTNGATEAEYFENTKFIEIISGGINIIDNCYCDSFCTFVDSSSQSAFIVTNSAYFSYINNVNSKLFILRNANCRYTITNNTFEMQTPATKHQGIVYTTFNNQTSLLKGMTYIEKNQISRIEIFNEGDLLCQVTDSHTPFWLNDNNALQTTNWALLGYVTTGYQYQQLKLNVEGYNFVANYKLERYGTNTYVSLRTKEKTNTNVTLELGFKYVGNTNGYNVYAVYLRQPSGAPLNPDITIEELNKNTPFIPARLSLTDVSYSEQTVDATYTL